jgi:CheY-like chemotaxis protein
MSPICSGSGFAANPARQGKYVMHFAASGVEALDRLAGEILPTIVAVLSDINMPGVDGLRLLGEIKQRLPDLPVMMVTAYSDDERRRRQRTRRVRVHHEAGGFRSVEEAATPTARRSGFRRRGFRLGSRGRSRPRPLCSIPLPSIDRSPAITPLRCGGDYNHAVSPAARRRPDSKSSRCSGFR